MCNFKEKIMEKTQTVHVKRFSNKALAIILKESDSLFHEGYFIKPGGKYDYFTSTNLGIVMQRFEELSKNVKKLEEL